MFVFLMTVGYLSAQRTVTGTITDLDGVPLIGANVLIKGTADGTITDIDGKFSLEVPDENQTLTISYTGYDSQDLSVEGLNDVFVNLSEGQILDEVMVVGYKTASKPESKVATQLVSSATLEARPNASIIQTLQGQVAGLSISTSSGQPGADSNINLRGVTSINGNTEPLIILDGTPIDEDNFRSINPNEIESISVLKDAGATAIYGNRGANGVIYIKTKNGSFNKGLNFSYSAIVGRASLQENKYDLMNGQEQLNLESVFGSGRGANISADSIGRTQTTDWLDIFFVDPITQQHNFSITTGSENFNSYTNFGYTDQEGVLVDSGLERYNLRTNLNGRSDNGKFNYGTKISLNFSNNNEPNSIGSGAINRNFILGALQSVPYISLDEYVDGRGLLSPLTFANTPLFLYDRLQTYKRFEKEIKAIGSLNASYTFFDKLTVSSNLGADFTDQALTRAEGPESFNALLFAQTGNETPGFQDQTSNRVFSYNWLNSILYSTTLNEDHGIQVGVYTELFRAHYDNFGFRNEGLDPRTFSPGDGSGFVDDNAQNDFFSNNVFANKLNAGLFSYFGSLDYDYKGKYGFGATIRRDASYRFSESNRWGTFYSVAARWNIDQESFMAKMPFDLLKLRASYGVTGNQRIVDSGGFLNYFGGADLTENFFATGGGYGGANSIFLSQIGNSTLKWETVEQLNVGLDFELLRSRLRGSVDYYVKTTEDLFQDRPVSAINSTNSLRANVGSLRNTGVDFNIAYDIFQSTNGFSLGVFFNTNYNKQNIIDLPTEDGTIRTGNTILREGSILFEYNVYRYAGVNPANGNLLFLDADGIVTENPSPDTDRVFTGKNIFPDFQGGFGLNVEYKGFFARAQFNYTSGVYRYDFDLNSFQDPTSIGQFRSSKDLLRAWDTEGQVTDIPSLTASNLSLDGASDRYLFDSDYVRLRYVELGYNLPNTLTRNIGIKNARIFANAENLQTWSSWRGFEADGQTNASRGYPNPKIVSLGLEVDF